MADNTRIATGQRWKHVSPIINLSPISQRADGGLAKE